MTILKFEELLICALNTISTLEFENIRLCASFVSHHFPIGDEPNWIKSAHFLPEVLLIEIFWTVTIIPSTFFDINILIAHVLLDILWPIRVDSIINEVLIAESFNSPTFGSVFESKQ
jgi:hypothetical protein